MPDTPRIVLHNSETASLADWLRAAHPDADLRTCNSHEALPDIIDSYRPEVIYSIRFGGAEPYPRDAILGPNGPAWVAIGGVGVDHFGGWDATRTTVTNAAGVAADMMAEYVIGGFLHFSLDVPGLQRDQAARRWDAGRMVAPLRGKTLLIVGLGHTGRTVAARARAFGMHVIGTRTRVQAMEHVDEVHPAGKLLDLLPRADFVAMATPLTDATRGLIGARAIAAMKPGVILADVSRGGVIDHAALLAALNSGQVAGAALDVFPTEPLPDDSPLWASGKLLISPHCSAVHDGWEKASFDLFLTNLGRWLRGEPLANVVDPMRGY